MIKSRGSLALTPRKPEGGHGNQESTSLCLKGSDGCVDCSCLGSGTRAALRRREPRQLLKRAGDTGKAGVCAGRGRRRCCAAEMRGALGEPGEPRLGGRRPGGRPSQLGASSGAQMPGEAAHLRWGPEDRDRGLEVASGRGAAS